MYWYIIVFLGSIAINVLIHCVWQYKRKKKIEDAIKQIQREHDESEEALREMLSNIAHDLKTPLTAIHGYAQAILDGIATTPERMTRYVTTIRNKSDDMGALVDELSFFSHIYKQDLRYHFVDVDVQHYISGCLGNLSLDLHTKKIDLLYKNYVPKGTYVSIDPDKMKRVFNNVIGNAAKYISKEPGLIYVKVEDRENDICVNIRDNGVGIAKEELPYIFNRFYRTDRSRNSKTGGFGLGLSITKKIVMDHAGTINAESEIGKGTTISFTIPKIS